jgi:hypothetical protein
VIIIAAAIALAAYGIIYIRKYLPKYNWNPDYHVTSSQPYGTEVMLRIFEETGLFGNVEVLDNPPFEALDTMNRDALYIFIGGTAFYDSLSACRVMKFIKEGNDAFIAVEQMPYFLKEYALTKNDSLFYFNSIYDSVLITRFRDSIRQEGFEFYFQSFKHKTNYNWSYIPEGKFDSSVLALDPEIISTIDSVGVNCWRATYGKGYIYFHTTPILFTNFHLISDPGYFYLNTMMSIVGEHEVCYWDEYNKMWNFNSTGRAQFNESPLKVLLSQRSLRLAYYMTLLFILFYLLFRAKRIQRPIPLVPENRNTSVEYVKAVGTLYYQAGNHAGLAKKMMDLFLTFVRQRYNISASAEQEDLSRQVVRKSEVARSLIDETFKVYYRIRYNPDPDKRDIIRLHSLLENFYKNCK